MNNQEKAARVIYDALSGQYGDFRLPTDAAEALADAGLLAVADCAEKEHPMTRDELREAVKDLREEIALLRGRTGNLQTIAEVLEEATKEPTTTQNKSRSHEQL